MPRFDGTGPNGQGERTGRGMGRCAPNMMAGQVQPGFGRRNRFCGGRGAGRGWGGNRNRSMAPEYAADVPAVATVDRRDQELAALHQRIDQLEQLIRSLAGGQTAPAGEALVATTPIATTPGDAGRRS